MNVKESVMRVVLLVLVVALLSPEVVAAKPGARWQKKTVAVENHAGVGWEPSIMAAVDEINTLLPKRAPRFVYRAGAEKRCPDVSAKGRVALCRDPNTNGITHYRLGKGRRILWAKVGLDDPENWADDAAKRWILCHELLHALTGAPERAVLVDEPCPFNARFAKKAYRADGERKGARRHR